MRNKFLNKMVSQNNDVDQISHQSTKPENEIDVFPPSDHSSRYQTCSNAGSEMVDEPPVAFAPS